jgi:K+-transporting ATPase ATPase A chain
LVPDLAWNTAASFTTNTNWQSYVRRDHHELSHPDGRPRDHNFWSAAVGIAVAVALIRGIKRTSSATIGNFWVDMTRTLLYVLLPASIMRLLLVAQGVPQNLNAYTVPIRSNSPPRRRPSRRAPWPRRKPSRCWAPTAADSSTPTAPTP